MFQQCATACPTTCANKDELIICLAVCQQGTATVLLHTSVATSCMNATHCGANPARSLTYYAWLPRISLQVTLANFTHNYIFHTGYN